MATETEFKDALYTAFVDFLNAETKLSSPSDHVALLDNTSAVTYPFVGYRVFNQPALGGVGSNSHVKGVTRDANGRVTQETRVYRYQPRVEISLLSEDTRRQSLLTDALRERIQLWRDAPQRLHDDVQRVSETTTNSISRPDSRSVVGQRLGLTVVYERYTTTTVDPITDINTDVREAESDATVFSQQ